MTDELANVEMTVDAGPHARFMLSAFDSAIGKKVVLQGLGDATVIAATVAEDGTSAALKLQCDAPTTRRLSVIRPGDYSFGFEPKAGITVTPKPAAPAD